LNSGKTFCIGKFDKENNVMCSYIFIIKQPTKRQSYILKMFKIFIKEYQH